MVTACDVQAHQSDVDAETDPNTMLREALYAEDPDHARIAIARGVDVNHIYEGVPVLFLAVRLHSAAVAEELVRAGADVSVSATGGRRLLHDAVRARNVPMVITCLEHGQSPDFADNKGWTPLMEAVKLGHLETVSILLEHGADPNRLGDQNRAALHHAARSEIAQGLLRGGANPDAKDAGGMTPLMQHARDGNTDTCKILIDCGADFTIQTSRGETALVHCAMAVQTETFTVLLDAIGGRDGADGQPSGHTLQELIARNSDLSRVHNAWRSRRAMLAAAGRARPSP